MALIGISGKAQSGKDTIGRIIQYLDWKNNNPEHPYYGDIMNLIKSNMIFVPDGYRGFVSVAKESKWEIRKFADKLKIIVSILTGIPVDDLEKEEIKNSNLSEEWDEYFLPTAESVEWGVRSMSVRKMLQLVGTDCLRNNLHTNVWVNALFADYKPIKMDEKNPSNWVITDVRFPNEAEAIKQRGGKLIKVYRNRFRCSNCSSLVEGKWICQTCGTDQLVNEPYSLHQSEIALDNYRNWDHIIDNNGSIEHLILQVNNFLNK